MLEGQGSGVYGDANIGKFAWLISTRLKMNHYYAHQDYKELKLKGIRTESGLLVVVPLMMEKKNASRDSGYIDESNRFNQGAV